MEERGGEEGKNRQAYNYISSCMLWVCLASSMHVWVYVLLQSVFAVRMYVHTRVCAWVYSVCISEAQRGELELGVRSWAVTITKWASIEWLNVAGNRSIDLDISASRASFNSRTVKVGSVLLLKKDFEAEMSSLNDVTFNCSNTERSWAHWCVLTCCLFKYFGRATVLSVGGRKLFSLKASRAVSWDAISCLISAVYNR